jgi:hypothetical protein
MSLARSLASRLGGQRMHRQCHFHYVGRHWPEQYQRAIVIRPGDKFAWVFPRDPMRCYRCAPPQSHATEKGPA